MDATILAIMALVFLLTVKTRSGENTENRV